MFSFAVHHLHHHHHHHLLLLLLWIAQSQGEPALDCLRGADQDQPAGVWSVTLQKTVTPTAILKNMRWPGHVFYHALESRDYGNVYNGTLVPNPDLAFMLPG